MTPLLAIVVVVGLTQLMASQRFPALDPVRARWRRLTPHVISWVRGAPATYTYLLIILVTTWVLETSSSRVARELLEERSTNLHELTRDPVRVLVASAFFVTDAPQWLVWTLAFTVVAAPVEQRIGPGRAVTVFAIGHVGASLLTAAGLSLALRGDLVEVSVARAVDVGASYGFVALAAVGTYLLPGRLRLPCALAMASVAVALLLLQPNFTSFGHLLAFLLGLSCYPLSRRPPGRTA